MNMDDKQKQIEEMAYSICGMPQAGYTNDITDCAKCFRRGDCIYQNFARRFLEKGYRKQSDTAREILDEVSRHFGGAWLVELYKKYGVEVEE